VSFWLQYGGLAPTKKGVGIDLEQKNLVLRPRAAVELLLAALTSCKPSEAYSSRPLARYQSDMTAVGATTALAMIDHHRWMRTFAPSVLPLASFKPQVLARPFQLPRRYRADRRLVSGETAGNFCNIRLSSRAADVSL
jgi:hypothetical protein